MTIMTMAFGSPVAYQHLNGARVDGSWYTDVVHFARDTPWLHGAVTAFTEYGVLISVALLAVGWWTARRADERTMTLALWAPVATVLAYGINNVVKAMVEEPRPCRAIHGLHTVLPCDQPTDWAFPSNHSAVVGAVAIALLLVRLWVGVVASVIALLMAASRVYVGAHYPHDVMAGLLLGVFVGFTGLLVLRFLAPLVTKLRATRLRPLLVADAG